MSQDEDSDIDDFDLVERTLYDLEDGDGGDEDGDADNEELQQAINAKFDDFFGVPNRDKNRLKLKSNSKGVTQQRRGKKDVEEGDAPWDADEDNYEEEGDGDIDDFEEELSLEEDSSNAHTNNDDEPRSSRKQPMSTHSPSALASHTSRMKEEIAQLEAAAVGPKSWELRGEVRATDRPANSLLEVTADVDRYVCTYAQSSPGDLKPCFGCLSFW